MAKQCKECNAEIGDKYEFCFKCSQKMKGNNKEDPWANKGTMEELITSINKLNSNIGPIRRILEENTEVKKKVKELTKKEKDVKKP